MFYSNVQSPLSLLYGEQADGITKVEKNTDHKWESHHTLSSILNLKGGKYKEDPVNSVTAVFWTICTWPIDDVLRLAKHSSCDKRMKNHFQSTHSVYASLWVMVFMQILLWHAETCFAGHGRTLLWMAEPSNRRTMCSLTPKIMNSSFTWPQTPPDPKPTAFMRCNRTMDWHQTQSSFNTVAACHHTSKTSHIHTVAVMSFDTIFDWR